MTRIFFIALLSICCSPIVILFGQNGWEMNIRELGYEDGMLGKRALDICQDRDGLMWVATVDGLNRYDGFEFRSFNRENSDLDYQEIRSRFLVEDTEGYLWLVYFDKIEFFHHETFEVSSFEERFKTAPFSHPNEIKYFNFNDKGQILITTSDDEHYLFSDNQFKHLSAFRGAHPGMSHDVIWCINHQGQRYYDLNGENSFSLLDGRHKLTPIPQTNGNSNFFGEFQNSELVIYDYTTGTAELVLQKTLNTN